MRGFIVCEIIPQSAFRCAQARWHVTAHRVKSFCAFRIQYFPKGVLSPQFPQAWDPHVLELYSHRFLVPVFDS